MDELERLMREATDTRRAYREACGVGVIDDSAASLVAMMNTDGPEFKAMRAATDALNRAAVNALPDLLAIKAERDRAQRACKQMGERITALENSLREIGAAIINGASDTLWMGDQISDETVVDFICNLTGDDPSLLGTFARAALNQEPTHE